MKMHQVDLELVLLQLDGQVIGHTNLQIDHRNEEKRPSDTELALARVDSSVLVVTNTIVLPRGCESKTSTWHCK